MFRNFVAKDFSLKLHLKYKLIFMIFEQVKTTASGVFTDLLSNSPKRLPRVSPGYEGKENMFYFLNVSLFVCFYFPDWSCFSRTCGCMEALFFIKIWKLEGSFVHIISKGWKREKGRTEEKYVLKEQFKSLGLVVQNLVNFNPGF